jgi:hypothetical protein
VQRWIRELGMMTKEKITLWILASPSEPQGTDSNPELRMLITLSLRSMKCAVVSTCHLCLFHTGTTIDPLNRCVLAAPLKRFPFGHILRYGLTNDTKSLLDKYGVPSAATTDHP